MMEPDTKSHPGAEALAAIPVKADAGMSAHAIKVACSNCNLRELCMPLGLTTEELDRIEDVVASRRKIKRGSLLFRNGEKFTSLYAIRTGFFKTCVASEDGRDQVTGFQMAGEVMGGARWRFMARCSARASGTAVKVAVAGDGLATPTLQVDDGARPQGDSGTGLGDAAATRVSQARMQATDSGSSRKGT